MTEQPTSGTDLRAVRRRRLGLLLGAGAAALMLALAAPAGLGSAGWRTAAVATLMATWWVTEALPIPVTALLPLALFPLLGIEPIRDTAAPYAHPLVLLFLGGFILALAMQRWGLPRRLALTTIHLLGTRPAAIVAGFMASCAFLSMWMSNTATAMMMLPIGLSVIELLPRDAGASSVNFETALMLGIAFACSIGGIGTLIGTPPNAFLAAFVEQNYGVEIGFAGWMALGVPLVLLGLPLSFWLLTRVAFPLGQVELPGAAARIEAELRDAGRISVAERRVAGAFAVTAAGWMTRPLLAHWISGLTDTGIAVSAAIFLFLCPSGTKPGEALMDWRTAERLPWGVLILLGGGLSLAAAFQSSGLTAWIGGGLGGLAAWPGVLLVAAVCVAVMLVTELASNTATTAAVVPLLAAVGVGAGLGPLALAVPAALAASCAFMLPVSTPPNAIVFGSGRITIAQMIRGGFLLNLLFVGLITAAAMVLLPHVFG